MVLTGVISKISTQYIQNFGEQIYNWVRIRVVQREIKDVEFLQDKISLSATLDRCDVSGKLPLLPIGHPPPKFLPHTFYNSNQFKLK